MNLSGLVLLIKKNSVYVTGIVFFVITGFLFNITIIQKQDIRKTHLFRMKLYYPRADGIAEGTRVFVKGVEVGMVRKIEIVDAALINDPTFAEEGKDKVVEVTVALTEPVVLWKNYRVRFNTLSVFSGRVIEVDPGSREGEEAFEEPTFATDGEVPEFRPLAGYYNNFFAGASFILLDNKSGIRGIISNTRQISDKLASSQGTVPRILNSDEMYLGIMETLTDARIVLKEARWYYEGYRKVDALPGTFSLSLYLNQTELEKLSNAIYNTGTSGNPLVNEAANIKKDYIDKK